MLSDVWGENAALFERLMEIDSNPPILYYSFKIQYTLITTNYLGPVELLCYIKIVLRDAKIMKNKGIFKFGTREIALLLQQDFVYISVLYNESLLYI